MDLDDLYMEYEDMVENGEIDPTEINVEDYVADRLAAMVDRAWGDYKDRYN